MFMNTSQLGYLNLSENLITSWIPEVFRALKQLTEFHLHNNKITTITSEMLAYLPSIKILNLADNPLICNCYLVWFSVWQLETGLSLLNYGNTSSYRCSGPDKWKQTALIDFHMPEDDCIDKTALIASTTASSVVIVMIILVAIGYHYRYNLYYALYFIRSRKQRLLEDIDNTENRYDAFVAYATDDSYFVYRRLLPQLEGNRGYRLCVSQRDWLPGPPIVNNITESIETR